jgi:hypothetical protein
MQGRPAHRQPGRPPGSALMRPVRFWTDTVSSGGIDFRSIHSYSHTPRPATVFDLTVNNVAGLSSELEERGHFRDRFCTNSPIRQ